MGGPSLVSVVIPTRNAAGTLGRVLERLEAQRAPFDIEILAVDSGSSDATLELLSRHGVRVHRIPPAEFDHGATRNLGVRLAKGDPIALLTQDAVPLGGDFLAHLVDPFADPRVAGVYGRQVARPDCDVVTRRQLEGWLTGRVAPARAELDGRPLEARAPAERHRLCAFDNVCSAIRRSVWERIPFAATDFGEDLEWGRAVVCAGLAIAYEPRAAVEHSHRRSIRYEYRRTRVCHRRLYELFGLATLPRRRDAARAALANLRADVPYVLRHAPPGVERLRQLARVAGLSLAGPLAQHHGYLDARGARGSGPAV